MVPEDFFAVGGFDLGFCGAPAVVGEAEDGVVVLALKESVSEDNVGEGEKRAMGLSARMGSVGQKSRSVPSNLWRRAEASSGLRAR